jgi:predicted transposase YdaD
MEESVTYQKILREGLARGLEEGREEGRVITLREVLTRQGTRRFGPPSEAVTQQIESLHDATRLEALTDRILQVESWSELLAEGTA